MSRLHSLCMLWLLPVFTGLFCILFLSLNPWDVDYFWHVRTGEYIVVHHALPPGDIFSWTMPGHHWEMHEWLAQVMLYLCARVGEPGVRALVALAVTLATAAVCTAALRIWPRPDRCLPLAFLILPCVLLQAAPRPLIFTMLFTAVFILILFEHKYHGHDRALWLLPPLMLLWVNLHAGYLIGIGLPGMFMLTECLSPGRPGRVRRLAGITVLCVLASLVNPGGIRHLIYPFMVASEKVNGEILEWRSPDFHQFLAQAWLLAIALYVTAAVYGRKRPDATEFIVPGIFITAGLVSARHIPLACLALVPFAAADLRDGLSWRQAREAPALHAPAKGRTVVACALVIAVEAVVTWQLYPSAAARQRAVNAAIYPVRAAGFLKAHHPGTRLFNPFEFGGYLIYRLYPQYRVMIDGRPDMYGDAFTLRHLDVQLRGLGWRRYFDEYSVDVALVQDLSPLRQLLAADQGWRLLYDDGRFAVLQRAGKAR